MLQNYEVTAETISDGSVQVTVMQKGETVVGVGNAPYIHEAFDLAHADYVKQLSNEQSERLIASVRDGDKE